jgi:hypothetical protein
MEDAAMEFSASLLLVCLTLAFGQRDLAIESPESIAHNIWIQPELRPLLLEVHAASPTFRDLSRFIDRQQRVVVSIAIEPAMAEDLACRAQCEMRLYSSGLLMARIRLPSSRDAAELVAHELEHVRERLEGVNVAKAYADRRPGVFRLRDGRFETLRARDLGLRVKQEVDRARPLLTTSRVTP